MRFLSSLLLVVVLAAVLARGQNPLFDYVNKPDPNYSYYDTGDRIYSYDNSWTGYVINMTSQQWLTAADQSRPIWTHQLVIVVPQTLLYTDVANIYITGGSNGQGVPSNSSEDILFSALLSAQTGTIGATLFQVPNQPTVFAADPTHSERGEDAFVAETWVEFMRNQQRPELICFLPMVKSVVRAMDTVTSFAKNVSSASPSKYFIYGASKRGWTTWLTGAVDKRVIGIAPIVFDMLNFTNNVMHMYQAYGGWTFAFQDYWELNITQEFGTENITALANIIDPLMYKEFLTKPKLIIDSTGDEFFMPDDDWYWWDDMKDVGETKRLFLQNAEHTCATGLFELIAAVDGFYQSLLDKTTRPQLWWDLDNGAGGSGNITAYTDTRPMKATMWTAVTYDGTRRDFRLIKGDTPSDPCKFIPVKVFGNACLNPVIWTSTDLWPISTANGTFTYQASGIQPSEGWRGFFIEFTYPGSRQSQITFTTQISIIPNTFPFPSCQNTPSGCYGTLV